MIFHVKWQPDRAAAHSGSKCPELAKNKFTWCNFTSFFTQTLAGLSTSTSVHCMFFIFKSFQIATATSMISQFIGCLNLIFGGFLLFGPTVQQPVVASRQAVGRWGSARCSFQNVRHKRWRLQVIIWKLLRIIQSN